MKKAVVMGAFSLIGYQLVQRLLLEEIEVIALDAEDITELSPIKEEKLLLIGRHAGFSYHSLNDETVWRAVGDIPDLIYFCLYEPNGTQRKLVKQSLAQATAFCQQHGSKIVFVSTVQFSAVRNELEKQTLAATRAAVLRVPLVYGPWQPSFLMYEQLLEADEEQQRKTAGVYVEDVAESLYHFATAHASGTYTLQDNGSYIEEPMELERGNALHETEYKEL